MEWDAQKYYETCGRVTEHGTKLVEVLKKMRCDRVLDLGCGTGVLTNEISEFAKEIIGVDASAAMIEKAKATYPNLQFIVKDACLLEWEEYFDAVFSNAVFHFIKTQDVLLSSIYKSLKVGGSLVCEFGADGNIAALLEAVADAYTKRGKEYSLRFYYPTPEEYGALLEKQNFIIDSMITYDLDTQLIEGEIGLRNWINQIFSIEMGWFEAPVREEVLCEIEAALRPMQWDGFNWHLPNRRIRVVAYK